MSLAGPGLAIAAAILFGAATPAAKMLLAAGDPWQLAGLLYLGSGLGLSLWRLLQRGGPAREAPIARQDWPWLGGAILSGGVVAPVLLMFGLTATTAATASLMLTLEGVATALIAWMAFGEPVDRRIALGMIAICIGSVVLAWSGQPDLTGWIGPVLIVAACVGWAVDNNLTRKVALADPLQIAALKGLIAGGVNLMLARLNAAPTLPDIQTLATAALIGFLGYGLSLVLYVRALREIGAARTGAYFAAAPMVGAVIGIGLMGDPLNAQTATAAAFIALGLWLHLTERHAHRHDHPAMDHSHAHRHDAHHRHEHGPDDPVGEPHTHQHHHAPIRHSHEHSPDAHHQHRH